MTRPGPQPIVCIGSVLWDSVGYSERAMRLGSDMPGRITRQPGGVAMNVAGSLLRCGHTPLILTAIGCDPHGEELLRICNKLDIITDFILRPENLPTDSYIAVEGKNGLVAAIADTRLLEACGNDILRPLLYGPLGTEDEPFKGIIAVDGNLSHALLDVIADIHAFSRADLRVVSASPGKAERLWPFVARQRGTLYVNRQEAEMLCQTAFHDSADAAMHLLDCGTARVLVTDGTRATTDADGTGILRRIPQKVPASLITGAGDAFMATHLAAEANGATRSTALECALQAAANHVSGGTRP